MNFVLAVGALVSIVMLVLMGSLFRKLHRIRRQRMMLEKYIGVRTEMGELVSLLNEIDLSSEFDVEIAPEQQRRMENRVGELTRLLVLNNGQKNRDVARKLRHMGFPLEYGTDNVYKYVLSHTTVRVPIRSPIIVAKTHHA